MIFNISLEEKRQEVLDFLKRERFDKVLDVGGSMFPWAKEVVTHYFDITNIHEYLKDSDLYTSQVRRSKMFLGDINDGFGWEEILFFVMGNEKFDFAICTQTLEDIRNPSYVLQMLPFVARKGFISVPHKYRELKLTEGHGDTEQKEWNLERTYLGYFHHRWIFSIINNSTLRLFPKLEFIHCLKDFQKEIDNEPMKNELSFWWEGEIPFEIVNNDFLGPNPPTIFQMYRDLIKEGI